MEIPAGVWLDKIKARERRGAERLQLREKAWHSQVISPRQPVPSMCVNTGTKETIKKVHFDASSHKPTQRHLPTDGTLRLKPEVEVLTTLHTRPPQPLPLHQITVSWQCWRFTVAVSLCEEVVGKTNNSKCGAEQKMWRRREVVKHSSNNCGEETETRFHGCGNRTVRLDVETAFLCVWFHMLVQTYSWLLKSHHFLFNHPQGR